MFNFTNNQGRVNKENKICLFTRSAIIKELLQFRVGKGVQKQAI